MKSKQKLILSLSTIMLITSIGCRSKSYQGKVKLGEDGKIVSGTTIQKCTPPQKRYAKSLDLKVKAKVDSLLKIPISELDLGVTQTITRLSDYTSEGLDFDLFYFRMCEMANNRGLSKEQTQDLLMTLMEKWNTNQELKKKVEQLELSEQARQKKEKSLEELKKTPPDFDLGLLVNGMKIEGVLRFFNEVPVSISVDFKSNLKLKVQEFFVPRPGWNTLRPKAGQRFLVDWGGFEKLAIPPDSTAEITFIVKYHSIYDGELTSDNLSGTKSETFDVDFKNKTAKIK